jgi:hypothetical protein
MDDQSYVIATAALLVGYFAAQVLSRKFDPFAPVWLFFVGYVQVYITQAVSYREWAVGLRGSELVTAANFRAFWALGWFLLVYHLPIGRLVSRRLPQPPTGWSASMVGLMSPFLIAWGLFCAGMVLRAGQSPEAVESAEQALFRSFPFVMLVAAVLLIVTGRSLGKAGAGFLWSGLAVAALYVFIWMFNGKRSHSLMGVLATVCAFYVSKLKRPSWPVLIATGFCGALVVAVAIGWRGNKNYEQSFSGFTEYASDFRVSTILQCLNIEERDEDKGKLKPKSYETEEYGGYLLMMDTVPEKSDFDYGSCYLKVISTFIPRMFWPDKPIYGREQWINAWIAGSEFKRDGTFTGPAIGLLGATQLNGGARATAIVLACIAIFLRSCYEFFRLHADVPWVQVWWSISYFNAWFMVVNDDPLIWFYYNWGFTTMPIVGFLWVYNKMAPSGQPAGQTSEHGALAMVGGPSSH